MKTKKKKLEKGKPVPVERRIEFLRQAIRSASADHGAPCMCVLCEALVFESMAREGKVSLE